MQMLMRRFLPGLACFAVLLLTSCSTCPLCGTARTELFNGKNLAGWNHVLADPKVSRDQVWTVDKGIIHCAGTPVGAIYTSEKVRDFRLLVEYRWPPGQEPGNSGIFSRITDATKPLPVAVEVQLKHGSAGDVLGLQGRRVEVNQPRSFSIKGHPLAGDIAGVAKIKDAEKPVGEWNRVLIEARGPKYTVHINDVLVNQADGVEVVSGAIGLQSEGGAVEFRRVTLTRLD